MRSGSKRSSRCSRSGPCSAGGWRIWRGASGSGWRSVGRCSARPCCCWTSRSQPFDAARQREIIGFIARLRADFGLPMLYVTHDRKEDRALADHVVHLGASRVVDAPPAVPVQEISRTIEPGGRLRTGPARWSSFQASPRPASG